MGRWGKAILIRTFPASSYFRNQSAGTREMFKSTVTVTVASGAFRQSNDLWGGVRAEVNGNRVTLTLPERDAAVLKLE